VLRTLLAIPAYGSPELADAVVRDLVRDIPLLPPDVRLVVVDNAGDYVLPGWARGVELVRTGENLRWIGTASWAFDAARAAGDEVVVLLDNDTRLSRGFLPALVGAAHRPRRPLGRPLARPRRARAGSVPGARHRQRHRLVRRPGPGAFPARRADARPLSTGNWC